MKETGDGTYVKEIKPEVLVSTTSIQEHQSITIRGLKTQVVPNNLAGMMTLKEFIIIVGALQLTEVQMQKTSKCFSSPFYNGSVMYKIR